MVSLYFDFTPSLNQQHAVSSFARKTNTLKAADFLRSVSRSQITIPVLINELVRFLNPTSRNATQPWELNPAISCSWVGEELKVQRRGT